ncbi:DUF6525 family protein [Roseomonas xinghualingensis]|uniref:DUF6525 family protein n=1 Tax=Roseomonas xinghualingensis TaxID=2986475 RepID=UPI0021F0A5D7|nr:DUF6525 family protein [Roseomonas sp. SXEYE001]MCV4209928.1 DUF6525 family protein [Roseomonas sp. SXEYE001]
MACSSHNDVTSRDAIWYRYDGDDWDSYDALPPGVRRRMQDHAYDPWAVNMFKVWKLFRRRHASSVRAERSLLNHLDLCERMELEEFDITHRRATGTALPHVAAGVSVLRSIR